eukprot:GFUD01000012.1.p1 GENE.GFUD01000012.1~~GFUD01000012.1.p1  ORF type:complete len:702 (+),score=282.39 GFUD01000012.1:61-2166(+)
MQVSTTNDVKIYNLSAGKSLPEWLTERKKRQLVKDDIDVRKRIELIQDFEMPAISDRVKVSRDGQYVLATGIYKPRLRCYDLHNLGLKFERCLDSEVVNFEVLSEDYNKVVFLHCDRYVEFHSQSGRYYRLRIPVFGRDMAYHHGTADMYFVGSSSQVYRLNLEQGRFLNSYSTNSPSLNCVSIMPSHSLVLTGSVDGQVEAWDPRQRERVGVLDCAMQCVTGGGEMTSVPQVTCLAASDGLNMAVGTSTGQVLLYDLRSSKPILTKDHMYGLPIKKVVYTEGGEQPMVLSMDSQVVRVWDRENGKPYTSIESTAEFNDLVLYPKSGLMFLANEQPRMQVFYVPSLGPAPRWASFLDSLTEELEESRTATVYDDYKFVTLADLQELGLDHLVGSPLLRAHLHGYFMDIRLYRKASSAKPANTLENMKKDMIKKQIEAQREGRVKIETKVPKVNKDLFIKLKVDEEEKKKKKKGAGDLLVDNRFGALFTDDRFEVDKEDETYRLINPVVSKLDKDKKKEFERKYGIKESDDEDHNSGDSDIPMDDSEENDASSDDDQDWTKELKKEHRNIQSEKVVEKKLNKIHKQEQKLKKISELSKKVKHTFSEVKAGEEFKNVSEKKFKAKKSKLSLEERLEDHDGAGDIVKTDTGHVMTFAPEKSRQSIKKEQEEKEHREERRQVRRSAKTLKKDKLPPRFWMGKRVR